MSWLLDHLIASGHVTETGATRRARIRTCGLRRRDLGPRARCREHVLVGLDDDRCALEVTVDPTPLSPLGEALALVEGRITYSLRRQGAGWILDPRLDNAITHQPAGSGSRLDVVRQHRCQSPAPVPALVAASTFPETRPAPPALATPPF